MGKENAFTSTWLLKTENDPLAAIRGFLADLWQKAHLEGMLVPLLGADLMSMKNTLIHDPAHLAQANPFVPVMRSNAGRLAAELVRSRPEARMALVLKACEVRALSDLVERDDLDLTNWLVIGVDCLGCFPAKDFEWRVQNAGSIEALTREVLRNAREGGIAIDRFRTACQTCARPEPTRVDLCVDLIGLPVQDSLLISARDDQLASRLELGQITAGLAPEELIREHKLVLKEIEDRRLRARQRQIQEPVSGLPTNLDELTDFLLSHQPCTECLEACPVLGEELVVAMQAGTLTHGLVKHWLMSCAECGMCEQACPKGLPIAAAMNRISRDLRQEPIAV